MNRTFRPSWSIVIARWCILALVRPRSKIETCIRSRKTVQELLTGGVNNCSSKIAKTSYSRNCHSGGKSPSGIKRSIIYGILSMELSSFKRFIGIWWHNLCQRYVNYWHFKSNVISFQLFELDNNLCKLRIYYSYQETYLCARYGEQIQRGDLSNTKFLASRSMPISLVVESLKKSHIPRQPASTMSILASLFLGPIDPKLAHENIGRR